MTIGVSIPAYSNAGSLRRCLRSVSEFVPEAIANVVVVDDSGTGQIAAALQDDFPRAQWIVHSKNKSFGPSATEAVAANPSDVVILLNDDVAFLSSPAALLCRAFQDERLFAVTFRSLDEHGGFREGAKRLVWRFGYPRILHNEQDQLALADGIWSTSYAVGGHAAFHRAKFLELGGLDPLYEPFYWEDVDLSVRAAKRGWHCIYSQVCVVRHAGQSAIRFLHDADYIRLVTQRNRILFARRHGTRLQRTFLELAVLWQRLVAWITRDQFFAQVLHSAQERSKHNFDPESRPECILDQGVPVDR